VPDKDARMFVALESFHAVDETGVPVAIARGQRVRAGAFVSRFSQWFVPADSDDAEIMRARQAVVDHP
jgi:hypothetical protein